MRKIAIKVVLISLIIFCLIGFVSASESIDETYSIGDGNCADIEESLISDDYDFSDESVPENPDSYILEESSFDVDDSLSSFDSNIYYFNSSKETNGDGSSWENADNSPYGWSDIGTEGSTVYLAEGDYTQNSLLHCSGTTFIGQGKNTRVSFFGNRYEYNKISEYTFINMTLTKYVNLTDDSTRVAVLYAEYDFINCSFVDLPISVRAWSGKESYTMSSTFENCEFLNATQTHLITTTLLCNLLFNICTFDNISADSLICIQSTSSDYVSIINSNFRRCNVKGIIYDCNGKERYAISNCTYDFDVNDTPPVHKPVYVNTTDYCGVPVIYVNNSIEISGDGSSWENATKDYEVHKGLVIHLSEGNYSFSGKHCTVIGFGDKTIINNFWGNSNVTVINVTFDTSTKHLENFNYVIDTDYVYYDISGSGRFINCTFINESFISGYPDPLGDRFRDAFPDVSSLYFENCSFINFSPNEEINEWDVTTSWGEVEHYREFESKVLFDSYKFSKICFNNCLFENISCECIVDSLGGQIDYNGIRDGAYIYNSTFKNCDVVGIIKARQISYCAICNCSYDFPVNDGVPLVGPFYINRTDRPVINTNLNVEANANSLIITLTDESNMPLVDYVVEIVTNGKVSYDYTNDNGKIILSNLLGNYSFEITFPGDEYEGYAPSKVFRSFTFEKAKLGTVLTATKLSATYNIAKNLVMTLKDANGKALANKTVTVKVGSISKNLKTNAKGQVSFNVATLVPKTYTATIKFAGDSSYRASSVSAKVSVKKAAPKLTAAKKTFKVKAKTKKLTATLKDNKGKVMKNTKLTLKVGKKTYTAKTNKKGVATFKVKLAKKGTYTGTVKFAGNKYFKAATKKVKIVVKK